MMINSLSSIRRFVTARLSTTSIGRLFGSNPLYLRFAKGASWSLIGTVISQGLTLLASIPVARLLGPTGYGELGIIQSTLAVFALFTGTSLGLTGTRYVAELLHIAPRRAGRMIGLTSLTALVVGGILSLLLFTGAPYLSQYVLKAPQLSPALRIASLVLFLSGLNGAQSGTLAGFQAFRAIAQINLWRGLISFPVMLLCVWRLGLMGAVVALAITAAVGVVLSQWTIRHETRKFNLAIRYREGFSEWRVLLTFTLPAILSGIVVVPVAWAANVMLVNQQNGYAEMGIFNATNQWRTALMFLPAVLTQPVLPMLSELYGTGSYQAYRRVLGLNLGVVFLATVIPAVGIVFAAPRIMGAYGFNGPSSALVLVLLSFAAVLSALTNVIGSVISSTAKMWHGLALNAIWAVAFIGFFATHSQDSLGLATAYLVSYVVHFLTVGAYAFILVRTKAFATGGFATDLGKASK